MIVKYILLVLIASLFHSTAIIALLIYPIYTIKYSKKTSAIIIAVSIISLITLTYLYPLISNMLGKEMYYTSMIGTLKLGNIVSTLIYAAMYLFAMLTVKNKDKQINSFYIYMLLVATGIFLVSTNMAVLSRAAQYYSIFSINIMPNIIENNARNSKTVIEIMMVFILVTYSSMVMTYRPEWNSAYNYRTCLFPREEYICE